MSDSNITLMNVVAIVFPKTTVLLCHFHIGKNVRAKCITDCRVKSKDLKVDGKDKEVKEVKLRSSAFLHLTSLQLPLFTSWMCDTWQK